MGIGALPSLHSCRNFSLLNGRNRLNCEKRLIPSSGRFLENEVSSFDAIFYSLSRCSPLLASYWRIYLAVFGVKSTQKAFKAD
jgi:hypothetical protein